MIVSKHVVNIYLMQCSNQNLPLSKKGHLEKENRSIIVYYVMRSKNEVLYAAAGRLAAERNEADKPAKAHKTIFPPNNI
jgi:hypothetical protein